MDDFKFHNCVNINKFESERVIEFITPDGFFSIINSILNLSIKLLLCFYFLRYLNKYFSIYFY